MEKDKRMVQQAMSREYFLSKKPAVKEETFRTECCDNLIERHILNKNNPEDWKLVEEHCEWYLNAYPKADTITPIFCECGRIKEYIVKLSLKKTW